MKNRSFSVNKLIGISSLIFFTTILSGCGNDSTTGTSQLNLDITDAPVDNANKVVIRFTGLEIHASGADNLEFVFCDNKLIATTEECSNPTVNEIDLLKLTGTHSEPLISDATIPAGDYQWIRLDLDDTNPGLIETSDGGEHPLTIPSSSKTGLKLNHGFSATDGGMISFTVDFDLRKSVHQSNGDYKLRPTLRLVTNSNVGSINGTVDATLIDPNTCSPAVYLYEGENVSPDDEGSSGANPVTTALVELEPESGNYIFQLGFIDAGNYTQAFTCEADQDAPLNDDEINFAVTSNTTVSANAATESNIQ